MSPTFSFCLSQLILVLKAIYIYCIYIFSTLREIHRGDPVWETVLRCNPHRDFGGIDVKRQVFKEGKGFLKSDEMDVRFKRKCAKSRQLRF